MVSSPGSRLSVLCVAYRSRAVLPGLLDSIRAHPPASGLPETIVADNSAGEPDDASGIATLITGNYPWVRYMAMPCNVGMGAALNAAARLASGDGLLLVNPDVEFTPGALAGFQTWSEWQDRLRRPVIVAPRLLNGDGSLQLSTGRFPNLLRLLAEQFQPRATRKYQQQPLDRVSRVDWATGACLLISAKTYRQLGGFDEGYFLYYEETDLCRRARRLGVWTVYDPSIACRHLHPLQDRQPSPAVAAHIRASRRRYLDAHGGPWDAAGVVLLERLGWA